MRTQTLRLYIVQCGEVLDTCSSPWYLPIKSEFEREYRWYKSQEPFETELIEAVTIDDALEKYKELREESLNWRVS